jgi:hypothetical protein
MNVLLLLVALLWAVPASAQNPVLDAAERLEQQGYFEPCRNGNDHACSYFVRLVVYTVNPNGDPSLPGALRKTAGGKNIDGYAEDAIALNGNPGDLHNVIDLVGGAGASGARLQWGGPHPRRSSDVWEAPKALSARELAVLGKADVPGPHPGPVVPNPGTPKPPPAPSVNLQPLLDALAALSAKVDALNIRADGLAAQAGATQDQIRALTEQLAAAHLSVLEAVDLGKQQLNTVYSGRAGFLGTVTLRPQR